MPAARSTKTNLRSGGACSATSELRPSITSMRCPVTAAATRHLCRGAAKSLPVIGQLTGRSAAFRPSWLLIGSGLGLSDYSGIRMLIATQVASQAIRFIGTPIFRKSLKR